jgi:hypothetical protein
MSFTIGTPLKDVDVNQWFQPPWPQGENLINNGTGELTHTVTTDGLVFYLSVSGGNRPVPLRFGENVSAGGVDPTGRRVIIDTPLETLDTGDPALFRSVIQNR